MPVSNIRKKQFRSIGHQLQPIVTVANKGLTDSVRTELERALSDHELIKIKLAIADRVVRKRTLSEVCSQCGAELIQEIGKVALIFRSNPLAQERLSNLKRIHS